MSEELEMINRLDNDAIVIEPEDCNAALEKWKTARRMAEEQLRKEPSPEWSFTAGYLCYMLCSRGACSFAITEEYLINGLVDGSKREQMAQFYLACLYFDSGKSREAIQMLEKIHKSGKDYFKKTGQEWRYVKSLEMLVAAHMLSGEWLEARVIGSQLEVAYSEIDEPDSMIPLALVGSLEKINSHDPAYEDLCGIAGRIVRITHSEDAMRKLFPVFSRQRGV